jgi:hypothetical protein
MSASTIISCGAGVRALAGIGITVMNAHAIINRVADVDLAAFVSGLAMVLGRTNVGHAEIILPSAPIPALAVIPSGTSVVARTGIRSAAYVTPASVAPIADIGFRTGIGREAFVRTSGTGIHIRAYITGIRSTNVGGAVVAENVAIILANVTSWASGHHIDAGRTLCIGWGGTTLTFPLYSQRRDRHCQASD